MKSIFKLGIIAVLAVGLAAASQENDNGKAGATGSPGENTCSQSGCHTGFANNSMGGSIVINSDIPGQGYALGMTYNISVTVAEQGINLFGLGFEALTNEGTNAGTLTPGAGTQIKNATIGGVQRKNIVHTLNGGAAVNAKTFSFTWTAPSTNVGTVTFYAAGNAANGNGGKSGDHIYNTSQAVEPDGVISVFESMRSAFEMQVYPNPATDELSVRLGLVKEARVLCEIMSLSGLTNRVLADRELPAGSHTLTFDVSTLAAGTYLLVISHNGHRQIRQIQKS